MGGNELYKWYRLAHRLGCSVQTAKRMTTSMEFVEWNAFFDIEDTEAFRRDDFYFAQIAAEIRRTISKRPWSVRVEHFLLKFKQNKMEDRGNQEHDKLGKSRSFWLSILGIKKK